MPPETNPDFLVIRYVGRIALSVVKQFWALSSAMFITICAFYWIFGGISAFLLLCFSAAGIVYHAGDKMLYYPEMPSDSRIFVPAPNSVELPFENVYFKSLDSVRLHAYFIRQLEPKECATLLFFHGNAGNIGHRLHNALGLFRHLHVNIFLVEYRGYGLSDGKPSESGLYKDAQAALNFLYGREDVNHKLIYVFGRSLGGAVAIDLASKASNAGKIACLIIENSFTSIPEMALHLMPWKGMKYIPLWLHKNKFQSKQKISAVECPVVFVSGSADQLVPPAMMLDLYTRCGSERKFLLQILRGDHNGTWTKPSYYAHLIRSIQEVCSDHFVLDHQVHHMSVQTV
nr:EOG090X09ZU [Macrothrix elegans]